MAGMIWLKFIVCCKTGVISFERLGYDIVFKLESIVEAILEAIFNGFVYF